MKKSDILFITANKGYAFDGIKADGYDVYHPYILNNLFGRVIREAFFRTPFLPKSPFYNHSILKKDYSYIILYDALITKPFLMWLHRHFPKTKIIFYYGNMVGKARHLKPKNIPSFVSIWTYDSYDAEKYGIKLNMVYSYHTCFARNISADIEYDILFVGKDKGRGDSLFEFFKKIECAGLRFKLIITKDGRFSRVKKYYSKYISYYEIVELIKKTNCILNIGMPNQKGITIRDSESLFFEKKLITNIHNIKNADLYDDNNVLIINDYSDSSIASIINFLKKKYVPKPELKSVHSFDKFVERIIEEQ